MPTSITDVPVGDFPAGLARTTALDAVSTTRLGHSGHVTIRAGDTVTVDLDRPAQDCTVTAADVLPSIAVPTAGVVQVAIANVTQARTIVSTVDIRTLTAPALALDTPRALTLGSGVALEADAGDLLRATVTMDGSAAPAPVLGVPAAQLALSLLIIPRSA